MSQAYSPSNNAVAGDPWDTAFLSERDVSSQVPINYAPHVGIHLTPACFHDGIYDDDRAQLCISNLVASQIRRFVVDIYWDPALEVFGLCPVRIPEATPSSASSSSSMATTRQSVSSGNFESLQDLRVRQTTVVSDVSLPSSATDSATTETTTTPPITSSTSASGTVLYTLGSYRCSNSLDIDKVLAVFRDYYEKSANTIDARLHYLIFNLHASRLYTSSDQDNPKLRSDELPQRKNNFASHFDNLDEYLYSPSQLTEERKNLNASWYRQPDVDLLPLNQYFTTLSLPNGDVATPDGWPNEGYIQFVQSQRVLLGYGIIGDEMQGYDVGQDTSIFGPGQLSAERAVTFNESGFVTAGCFFNASQTTVAQLQSSWTFSSLMMTDSATLGYAADNLTTCGISPMLNTTLADSGADDNPLPYQSLGNQALFSWAADQPPDASDYGDGIDASLYRCAIIVSNSDNRGHWRVADCQAKNYAACRVANEPYQWTISDDKFSYAGASNACKANSSFDVPRTGLENNYLHQEILRQATQRDERDMIDATWINFNSLDYESCWITTGYNGTCPYRPDDTTVRQRQILVPAIAAFIVLLLTVLTILVKCGANRRNSKIRKRGEGGWDYEGVPS